MAEAIDGAKMLIKKFEQLDKRMQREVLVRAAIKGAEPMAARARHLAPRDTGGLALGIQVKRTARKRLYGEASVTHRKRAAHAILQEYGVSPHTVKTKSGKVYAHPGHKPQPFFRPAFEELKDTSAKIVTENLKREILMAAR